MRLARREGFIAMAVVDVDVVGETANDTLALGLELGLEADDAEGKEKVLAVRASGLGTSERDRRPRCWGARLREADEDDLISTGLGCI